MVYTANNVSPEGGERAFRLREVLWRHLFTEVVRYRDADGRSVTEFRAPTPEKAAAAGDCPHCAKDLPTELIYVSRLSLCGRVVLKDSVGLAIGPGQADFVGVHRCANVWGCPVCHRRIMAVRREELQTLVTRHQERPGRSVAMLTLTLPHTRFDDLAELRKLVRGAWRALLQGKQWVNLRVDYGITGYVSSMEVTNGRNGWHPHLHCVLLLDRELSDEEREALERSFYRRWARYIGRTGHPVPLYKHADGRSVGADLRRGNAGVADYISKIGLASEMTSAASKRARGEGHRTPWDLLDDFATKGDLNAWRLFREYLDGMKGARQMTWSRGLKTRYAIGEVGDQEAAERPDPSLPVELIVDRTVFELLARRRGAVQAVRRAAIAGGVEAAELVIYEHATAQQDLERRCTGIPWLDRQHAAELARVCAEAEETDWWKHWSGDEVAA